MTDPFICEFRVESFVKGRRIETFLNRHLRTYTSWRIQRMLKAGCVTVNDAPAEMSHRVKPGEIIRIRPFIDVGDPYCACSSWLP